MEVDLPLTWERFLYGLESGMHDIFADYVLRQVGLQLQHQLIAKKKGNIGEK